MKVLWFSPVPLPAVCRELNLRPEYGGWWVHSMLTHIAGRRELEIAVAWPSRHAAALQQFSDSGVRYYVMPDPGWLVEGSGLFRKVADRFEPFFGGAADRRAVAAALRVVDDYVPDLVHVFGAEHRYGLVAPWVSCPTVVWMQGILDVYQRHHFGSMACLERLTHPQFLLEYLRVRRESGRERKIYRSCRHFIGRTNWDRAHQARLQPNGQYYKVQDCLRPEFHEAAGWSVDRNRSVSIYTTSSGALLKGTDVLLESVKLLRTRFPSLRLRVAGVGGAESPVAKRLSRLVRRLGISDHVEFLGVLNAGQIVGELTRARVFVLPSFIENNPNSLAEAQMVGTPVVAAFAGGVPDMVVDGETGLLFQAGDSSVLASQIARLLTDEELGERLSSRARAVAHHRHAPGQIGESLLSVYEHVAAGRVTSEGAERTIPQAKLPGVQDRADTGI
jgi:glycosyltransferase involved in cell wall biosynthesis